MKAVRKITAAIRLGGEPNRIVMIRTGSAGNCADDLSQDVGDGARFERLGAENAVRMGLAQVRSTALEGGSVSLTIEEQSRKINPQMKFTPEAAFALAAAVEVRCHSPVRKATGICRARQAPNCLRQLRNRPDHPPDQG
ncbi:hypothetical protein [Cereibacter sphaeroides]|uniref:hypothetical protein n=1 Tax=Cereibacter sphaeroides TaxID=1063 RepID=UPI00135B8E21